MERLGHVTGKCGEPNISGTTSYSRVTQPAPVGSPETTGLNLVGCSGSPQDRCRNRLGDKTCRGELVDFENLVGARHSLPAG